MKEVLVSMPKNDTFLAQFISLYNSLNNKSEESLIFNLKDITWIYPLLVLPLSSYITKTDSQYILDENSEIYSYMNNIGFPIGIKSCSEFEKIIRENRSYIPISVLKKDNVNDRQNIEALFSDIIYKNLGSVNGAKSSILYPIGELVTNIFEHSNDDKGFIFAQNYPNKGYLDICIVDTGRGFKNSYKEEKNIILTDKEAIIEVMRGNSTKKSKERGYGVWTSKKVICNALGGQFLVCSGSALLLSNNNTEKFYTLPDFYWQGVIISARINKPNGPIDISSYIE